MSLPAALNYIRSEVAQGRRMTTHFADPGIRALGYKRIWAARRIAQRLGYRDLATLGIDL